MTTSKELEQDNKSAVSNGEKYAESGAVKNIENKQKEAEKDEEEDDDDEPDDWDKRIINTGCAEENQRLQLCHYDTNDWRQCLPEMEAFKKCWAQHNNNQRTQTKDNDLTDF